MIPVEEIWQYFLKHKEELVYKHVCIADFPAEETEIYITNEYGYPSFSVDVCGFTECEEIAIDKKDTEDTYASLLGKVTEDEPDNTSNDADDAEIEDTAVDEEDNEYFTKDDQDRISEIHDAVYALLGVMLEASPEDAGFDEAEIDLVAEEVEDILANKFGAFVRHPTVIRNKETGLLEVVQYPYA